MSRGRDAAADPARVRRRRLAVAAALLLASAVAAAGSSAGAPPAAAAPDDGALVVEITDVTPAFITPGSPLTVRGSVRNDTGAPVSAVDLDLRLQRTTPASRQALDLWLDPTNAFVTLPLAESALDAPVADGASAGFTLDVPAGALSLPTSTWGPRGLEVRAGADGAGGPVATAARTLTVWYPGSPEAATSVSVLVPLVPQASEWAASADGAVPVASASAERIRALVGASAVDAAIAWGLDPALLAAAEPPSTPADQSSPTTPADQATPAPQTTDETPDGPAGDVAAAALRATLVDGAAGRDVIALPYADADVAALAHAGDAAALAGPTAAGDSLRAAAGVEAVPGLAWAAGERTDALTLEALAAQGAGAVVVAPGELAPTTPITYTPTGRASVPAGSGEVAALVPDAELSDALAGQAASVQVSEAGAEAVALEARQYLLASTAAITRERPGENRSVLAVLPRTFDGEVAGLADRLATLASAPWLRLTPLTDLRDTPAPDLERAPLPDREVEDGEVGPALIAETTAARRALADFAPIVEDPAALVREPDARLQQVLSAAWRTAPGERAAFAGDATRAVADLQTGVGVVDSATVNLISASGELPVAVRNDLDQVAAVALRLTSSDPALQLPAPVPVEVPANSEVTVGVAVHAVGSADVTILAELVNEAGARVGTPAALTVRVRADWENVGTAVLAGAIAVGLVFGLVRSIRRGRRRGGAATDGGPADGRGTP